MVKVDIVIDQLTQFILHPQFTFDYVDDNHSRAASDVSIVVNTQNFSGETAIPMIGRLNPSKVRFSQNTVNDFTEIHTSMVKNGWRGEAIDVVMMDDGMYTTIDNTRLVAAQDARIKVYASIHQANDPLPTEMIVNKRFESKKGEVARTWGEAIKIRVGKQSASFRNAYPNGSFTQPRKKN